MTNNIFIKGKIDKRLVHRLMLKGEMSESELKEYLASLPDLSENAEEMTVTLEECRQDQGGEM